MVDSEVEVNYDANIVNECWVSPPAGSVATTNLPLSFFDMLWIPNPPMRRFFFYDFPHSTHHFMDAIFPTLTRSLSLVLQHFFPLAGNLIFPSQPHTHKPHILYTTAHDSVPLTVAESPQTQSGCDVFNRLIADYPRHAKHLYPFVPGLPKPRVLADGTRVVPLLALQITVFPNRGLCFCVAFHHVAADGMAAHHFIKSWASMYRDLVAGGSGSLHGPPPNHDRAAVKDPNDLDLESIFLQELSGWASSWNPVPDKPIKDLAPTDKDRATFVLTKAQIERLKTWVSARAVNDEELGPLRLSAFVVTCSLIWVCMIQSTESELGNGNAICNFEADKSDEPCYLVFAADCRNRLKDPIPFTYFGNCIDICVVELKKNEILKRHSIVGVARAIGERVKEFESEPLKTADKWFSAWRKCEESGRRLAITGSPRLRVYDTDFGWGKPQKSEILNVDSSRLVCLQESRDGKGGIEVGLGLTKTRMDRFVAMWDANLKLFCS